MQYLGGVIMKKLKSFILGIFFAIVMLVPSFAITNNQANALNFSISYETYSEQIDAILDDFCVFNNRIAGSENEKQASEYINNYLKTNTSLFAKNDSSTESGVQTFKFLNDRTGVYNTSQNIIYQYKAPIETKKKVILTCNYDVKVSGYDADAKEYISEKNDALNSSSGSVACALMLAKTLSTLNLGFDLEFVFFGAGENSYAGSEFYLNGISDEDAKNILCVINLDKIAVGKNIYFYMDEVESDLSKYITKTCSSLISEIDLTHLNKTSFIESGLGLNYSHIALGSDNVKFMSRGIATMNIFAGEYENGIVLGYCEFDGKDNIAGTKNDTREYVANNYGGDVVANNLYKVSSAIENLLTSEKFVETASSSYKSTSWFYKIFANEKLSNLMVIIAFFLMLIVAMFIYYKLTVKSYHANVEVEFLSSVVKIADEIDGESSEKDTAKIIGQVLANDIKKDKTLKPEKKKKDK